MLTVSHRSSVGGLDLQRGLGEGFSAGGSHCTSSGIDGQFKLISGKGLVDDDNLYEWEIMIIGYVEYA